MSPLLAPTVLPGRAYQKINRVPRCLLAWRASDGDLATIAGVAATFARTSADGETVDVNGVLRQAVHSQPSWNFQDLDADGVYETPALSLEDTRTNSWLWSEDFSNAAWVKTNATVSANAAVSPDGNATADKLVEDASVTVSHQVAQALPALTAATLQSVCIHAKAGERTILRITTVDKANVTSHSWINVSTGVVGTKSANHTFLVTKLGNAWYKIEMNYLSGTGGTTPTVAFALANADNVTTYTGDAASGLYLWGAQFETDQPWPTTYVPTVGSTSARSAESFSWPFNALPQAMTVYHKFTERGNLLATTGAQRLWQIGSTAAGHLRVAHNNVGHYTLLHQGSGGTVSSVHTGASPNPGDVVEVLAQLMADGSVQLSVCVNGGAENVYTQSAGTALASAWNAQAFNLNSAAAGANAGFAGHHALKVAAGLYTFTQMREML